MLYALLLIGSVSAWGWGGHGGYHGSHHGGHGSYQSCTRGDNPQLTLGEQNDALLAVLSAFEDIGTGTTTTTTCQLKVKSSAWPHVGADRRLLRRGGHKGWGHGHGSSSYSKGYFNVTSGAVSEVATEAECLESVSLTVSNVVPVLVDTVEESYEDVEEVGEADDVVVVLGNRRNLGYGDSSEDEEKPVATVTLAQTSGSDVSFDLTVECEVDYDRSTCEPKGLECRKGTYTLNEEDIEFDLECGGEDMWRGQDCNEVVAL